jgi:possible [acyl-carrier-protein] S-malonyltransferase
VAFACGMTAVLRENGIKPDYALGLSLGEYSALEAASVFSAKTAVEMVAFRGKKMEEASKGIESSMAAILGMSEEALDKVCKEVGGAVSLCNLNCPGQIVIGGEKKAVEEASKLALEAGAKKAIPLKVSGPFHTSFMKSAGEALREYFKDISFREGTCPVLHNFLGRERQEGDPSVPELLVEQVQKPVRMEEDLRRLLDLGVRNFVEIGPGKTISGFLKKTAKDMGIEDFEVVSLENKEELEAFLERKKA